MNETKRKFGLKHGLGLVVALAVVAGLAIVYRDCQRARGSLGPPDDRGAA